MLTILMAYNDVEEAYPSFGDEMQAKLTNMECGVPTREIADRTFFKAIEDYDPDSERLLYQLDKYHREVRCSCRIQLKKMVVEAINNSTTRPPLNLRCNLPIFLDLKESGKI